MLIQTASIKSEEWPRPWGTVISNYTLLIHNNYIFKLLYDATSQHPVGLKYLIALESILRTLQYIHLLAHFVTYTHHHLWENNAPAPSICLKCIHVLQCRISWYHFTKKHCNYNCVLMQSSNLKINKLLHLWHALTLALRIYFTKGQSIRRVKSYNF